MRANSNHSRRLPTRSGALGGGAGSGQRYVRTASHLAAAALLALAVILSSAAPAMASRPSRNGGTPSIAAAPGGDGLSVQTVVSPYAIVFRGQTGIPVRIDVRNETATEVMLQGVQPFFTLGALNDRADDYAWSTTFTPTILQAGESLSVDLVVTVAGNALLDTLIAVDGAARGLRLDDFSAVGDTFAVRPHAWRVVAQGLNAIAALYHTRQTADRSDDSLIARITGENFLLNEIHALNGGAPLADLFIGDPSFYRLVLQLKPSTDWDWEPKSGAKGYFGIGGASGSFAPLAAPLAGIKELLIPPFFVPDENTDAADFVIGATKKTTPPIPWTMISDPWTDPLLDAGKSGEIGQLAQIQPGKVAVTCIDPLKTWEITGNMEKDRYTFFELTFLPDLEWRSGDTADVYLRIEGKPNPSHIDELHLKFRLVDDDTLPPVFSSFNPEIVPAGQQVFIECKITDPSGVYDDATGSTGQGVHLVWDTDGSLVDDSYEALMSPIGGGYYRTDASLGSFSGGMTILYQVRAFDDDADGGAASDRCGGASEERTVQILGLVYLVDEPASLYPASVFPGQTGISFHIDLANTTPWTINLTTASTLSFTDGARVVTASLRNAAQVPSGAAHYPVSFTEVDIPADFSSPDTVRISLDLIGSYGATPFRQTYTTSETNVLSVREKRIVIASRAISGGTVRPGEANVLLLGLEATNESHEPAYIDSLAVSNATIGSAPVPISDANFGLLRLYRRSALFAAKAPDGAGADTLAALAPVAGDSLLATASLAGGAAVFRISGGLELAPGQTVVLAATADVDSFMACDGDSLDLAIPSTAAVGARGGAVSFASTPLNSSSRALLDGFVRHQIPLGGGIPDTLFLGEEDQPVLSLWIPQNGYKPDVLTGISVMNYGDARIDTLVERLGLWLDDGDETFSPSGDSLVGALAWTGAWFEASGLSMPLLASRLFFVTADLRLGFVSVNDARFGIPADGVRCSSGNDGPIDGALMADAPQRVVRWETITLEALTPRTLVAHPGAQDAELVGFRFHNATMGDLTIDTLRVRGASALFGCAPTASIALRLDDGDEIYEPSEDALLDEAVWSGGKALFPDLDLPVGVNQSRVFFATVDLDSLLTPDGDTLRVGIESIGDIAITRGPSVNDELYRFEADFPVRGEASPVTDGMMLHQVTVHEHGDSAIVDHKRDIVALDFTIPANGCRADVLTDLAIKTVGTFDNGLIQKVGLYRDDGDGVYEPGIDTLVSNLRFEAPDTWRPQTALSVPLSAGGVRFYVVADLQDFGSGGTLRASVPQGGISVASGNDGPIDGAVMGETSVIPLPDRITVFASPVGNKRALPGDKNVLNFAMSFYNSYGQVKSIDSISFVSTGTAAETEIAGVAAFADSDDDGLFNPAEDSLLRYAAIANRSYVLKDLGLKLASYKNTILFIVYSVPLFGVRDSVSVDFQVVSKSSFGFDGEPPALQGEFPLNSAGLDVTDGMVAAQIPSLGGGSGRVPPGAENAPCLSFVLPCNGTYEDELRGLALENLGTALAVQDIAYLRLWRETGGDPLAFGPEDAFLGFLAWDGSLWRNVAALSEPLPCGGTAFHVTADVAASAADDRTIKLALPLQGVRVATGNDGPVDAAVESRFNLVITTDPLFASFLAPAAATKGREFEVRMLVSNEADTTIYAVVPDSFAWEGSGGVALVSGPVPASIDLAGGSDSAFVWRFSATSLGAVAFRGKAVESGGAAASLLEHSSDVDIEEAPQSFYVVMDDLMPVDLNRGQKGNRVVECVMSYTPVNPQSAGVLFSGLAITFTNAGGTPIAAMTVASRVALEDETQVLYASSNGELAQPTVNCVPAAPVLLEPSDSRTLRISIDVADTASASSFRIRIASGGAVALADENCGVPVPFSGTTFPWSTNAAALNDPATALAVRMSGTLPSSLNKGQDDVAAFDLVFKNTGGPAAADVSVSEIRIRVIDAAGDSLEAGRALRTFRLAAGGMTRSFVETFEGLATIRCALQPPLIVSPQSPVSLRGLVDAPADPLAPGFALELADSTSVAARDANSGAVVAVEPDTLDFPYRTGYAIFRDPARTATVMGGALLPAKIMASASGVPAMRIALIHPGSPSSSPVRWSALGVRLLDELGRGIEPETLIDAIRVRRGAAEIVSVYVTAAHGSDIALDFATPVVVLPGQSDTLAILLDMDAAAEPSRMQLHVNASQVIAYDATDGERIVSLAGEFPLTSGIGEIVAPAGSIVFDADGLLPSNVASGDEAEAFAVHFARGSSEGGSLVFIDSLFIDALGAGDVPIDPASIVQSLRVTNGGAEIASSWSASGGRIRLALGGAPPIASGSSVDLVIAVTPVASARTASFALRIAAGEDVRCRDELTGDAVPAAPEHSPGFPYLSGRAALLARDAEKAFSNYPNPFVAGAEATRITFFMPAAGRATLAVYTITGEPVRVLLDNEAVGAGLHQDVTWDGTNGEGERVLNGVYYLLLKYSTGGSDETLKRKVALLR